MLRRLLSSNLFGPFMLGIITVACALIAGLVIYWQWIQPDPDIKIYAKSVLNAGVDKDGVNLNQWVDRNRNPYAWTPVEIRQVRPGQTIFVARDVEFLNKVQTSEATVTRAFLGCTENAGAMYTLPPLEVPTRSFGRIRRNFMTVIPDLPPGCWKYHVAVLFYKNPWTTKVRVPFDDVVLEVVK